jgi:hypothetical protein
MSGPTLFKTRFHSKDIHAGQEIYGQFVYITALYDNGLYKNFNKNFGLTLAPPNVLQT